MNFRIGEFEIHPGSREVLRGGCALHAQPRLFDLLMLLVEHGGALVSKDEMVRRVWDGRAISDDAIASALRDLRALLGDDGRRQEVIRMVHGASARLAVPVEPLGWPPEPGGGAASGGAADAPDAPDACLPEGRRRRPAIAVMPLRPLAEADRPLCRAATIDLTIALARTRWLFVSSHGSAARFAGGGAGADEIARRLGVRWLLSGSLARDGSKMRLSLLLTDTNDGRDV